MILLAICFFFFHNITKSMINYADWLFFRPIDLSITVAAGSGTVTFNRVGEITHVAIKAATAAAIYDISIFDDDDYLIYTQTALTGNSANTLEKVCFGKNTFEITGATVNGLYLVRLYGVLA